MRGPRTMSLAAAGPVAAVLIGTSAGCGDDPFPLEPGMTVLSGHYRGMVMSLEVEPDEVEPHGEFTVTFRMHNPMDREVAVGTPHSCLALPRVYLEEERVPFRGTSLGCLARITNHVFEPGETVTRSWNLSAEYFGTPGFTAGEPAPPGKYRVRVTAEFSDSDGARPWVELPLVVTDPDPP